LDRITEIKTTLSGARKEFDCELLSRAAREVVVIYRMPNEIQLEDLLLPKDSISLGYFWEDRAYNVYHWVDQQRQTLALYFNICDNTHISADQVAWRDLTIDILITPDLRCRVLDEDELPDDIDTDLLSYIIATRDALCADPAGLLSSFEARRRELLPEY
jgi:predicted RNA-binding protein associated with RNAse of E/G family